MRYFITLALASLLIIATAVPSEAKVVAIHAIAPLRGHGERSIQSAMQEAVQSALRDALAMGFPWVRLTRALVMEDAVAVQILATDIDPEAGTREEAPGPDSESAPSGGGSSGTRI